MQMTKEEARIGIMKMAHWKLESYKVDDVGMPSEVTMKNPANPYLPETVKLYPRHCFYAQEECDRCGKPFEDGFEGMEIAVEDFNEDGSGTGYVYVCESCYESFGDWLYAKDKETRR